MKAVLQILLRSRRAALAALLALPMTAVAQPAVRAWTDSSSYQIGRWIVLHTEVGLPEWASWATPVGGDTTGPFELLRTDSLGVDEKDDQHIARWRFTFTSFDTGAHELPGIRFAVTGPGRSDTMLLASRPLPLLITTVSVDLSGDLKDIKPPLTVSRTLADWTAELILLVAFILLEAALLWRRLRRRKLAAEEISLSQILPPHEIALMALREIEENRFWQHGRVKEYYSAVTEVVRRYLGALFSVPALEVTSDELLQTLSANPDVHRVLPMIRSFLTTADLVKFARYRPTPEENDREMSWAYDIVRELIPKPVVPAETAKEEAYAG